MAAPGTIAIDGATRRLVGDLFDLAARGAVSLKGLPAGIEVFEVLSERTGQSRFEALHPAAARLPLVGRQEELDLLLRRWAQAQGGQGRVVLVSGEAGIGKSRLLAALEERLQHETFTRLCYFCSPHHQDTPLHPVIDQLDFAAGFARDDPPADRLQKLRALLAPTDPPIEDVALFASLLQLPADGLPALNFSPQRQKERTFAALIRQLERLSQSRPLLLLFEDLHWADPSTRELLDDLIRRVGAFRALLVMTFRPEFQAPWSGHAGVTSMTLSRLDRSEATSLALQLTTQPLLSAGVLERIVAQSDGVPLFIEELSKAVMEAAVRPAPDASALAVPATLQASLLARLDRIPAAKQVAQLGAVFGRDFSYRMISAVGDLPPAVLNDGLDQLVASGLIFCRGEPPETDYTFKHSLVQDAAYDSLLRTRRVALHGAIGDLLERDADVVATSPALLGHHFAQAGAVEKAVPHLLRAGEQSAAASAMVEAQAHLTRGLALAAEIANASERTLRQAELMLALGNVQMAMHGFGSSAHGAAFSEAVRLCRSLGPEHERSSQLLARALFGNWSSAIHAGSIPPARDIARDFYDWGRSHADPTIRDVSATTYGATCFFLAEVEEGAQAFSTALADPGPEAHAATAEYGIDVRCLLRTLFSRLLAYQGFAEQAQEQARAGLQRARRLQHLPSIAISLVSLCTTDWILRDQPTLAARSAALVRLAREQSFGLWLARGKGFAGWIAAAEGKIEEGRALITEGLAELGRLGVTLYGPDTRARLADVYARMDRSDLALAVLDEGLGLCAATGEIWMRSELQRKKGELLQSDLAAAELCFQQAIELARNCSAKLFELRAAVSLARLWREQDRRDEAQALLAPIHDWFTEGFDIPDLAEARALLDTLAVAAA